MMNKELIVNKSIRIEASPEAVWQILTDPEKIKIYLYGTETITDWKVGSSIVFQGEYNGQQYRDKGNVLSRTDNKMLQYNYWSGFSGLEDTPENYSLITYNIESTAKNIVTFTWTQQGFSSEEGKNHTENGLATMLDQIKQLSEAI